MIYVKDKTDYLLLSTEGKPSSPVNGSTLYEVDTGKFYIFYKGTWYEQGAEETETETEENSNQDGMR